MKDYVVVGTGGRGTFSFIQPLHKELSDTCTIAGCFDTNPKRLEACRNLVGLDLELFDDFDQMLDQVQPDGVIVTSVDATHAEYVIKALERDITAISEKPLCTTVEQVQAIRRAAKASQAKGFVTHNVRFNPDVEIMKQRILAGDIGDVLSIQFTETLDREHGADYFRRWHGRMANSGGLLIHKSSHHFDIINWLADSLPETVTAQGRLAFYGHNGPFHGPRCSACPHANKCDFYTDIFSSHYYDELYRQAESEDGYFRDGCVFDPEIDIQDTMSVSIRYDNDVIAGYNLIAYASYESMRIAVEGTRGRLELYHTYGGDWSQQQDEGEDAAAALVNDSGTHGEKFLRLYDPLNKELTDITAPAATGGHGGADPKLRRYLFADGAADDPLNQRAPLEEGIQAVLVGLAANASIATNGQPISISELAPPL